MMKTYRSYLALSGLDEGCASYLAYAAELSAAAPAAIPAAAPSAAPAPMPSEACASELQSAIVKGLGLRASALTESLIASSRSPLSIIESEIIPALNTVGEGFENKTVYLPQLLMSAEAASAAFACIKKALSETEGGKRNGKIVLATVKGDIHDIGKNIVKLLLENYGFSVTDLGRDVAPQTVLDAVLATGAGLCGLSALMTTTVPAMEETIRLLHARAPRCKVIVGGAVLTKEYADAIGADHYAKDAMGAVRYAEEIFS
jgi:5-methyltetrahydrofolate--homocysteine methyltransferase